MDSPEILSSSFKPQLPRELKPKTSDAAINLDILPSEMVEKILLESDLETILNFCRTSKAANEYCQSGNFWKRKYQQDYPNFTPLEKGDSWKERYQRESILSAQLQFGNIPISAGYDHWCFIHSTSMFIVGEDEYGQRGHRFSYRRRHPAVPVKIGRLNSSMKYDIYDKHNLDVVTHKISFDSKIISFSCGRYFTGAVTMNGTAYLWGSLENMLHWSHTQPGFIKADIFYISIIDSQKAYKIVTGTGGYAVFMENGEIYIRNSNNGYRILPPFKNRIIDIAIIDAEEDDIYILDQRGHVGVFSGDSDIIPVNLPEPIKQLSAGDDFWVALSKSGNVYTWGNNDKWQLGFKSIYQPTFDAVILGMSKMREYFGYRSMRPKYKLDLPHPISFISAGDWTVAAVAKNGKLYIWGFNDKGNIDIDDKNKSVLPTEVNLKTKVKYVSVGGTFTVAVNMDGDTIYWGNPKMDPAMDKLSSRRYKLPYSRLSPYNRLSKKL